MKNFRVYGFILVATIFAGATALDTSAQMRTRGDVIEVIDGKTVTLAVPTGRVTVELQYIDVPDPEQSLHTVVKDHVRTLLVGKTVELQTKGFTREKVTGKLTLDGVDVSQQLLRNGAAWHLKREVSGQDQNEFGAYAESQELARLEKRGVWSVSDLEPAWVFREKKREQQKLQQAKPTVSQSVPGKTAAAALVESGSVVEHKAYWADQNPWLKDPGGLMHGYNAATRTGFLGTSVLPIYDLVAKKTVPKAAIDIKYYYTEMGAKGRKGYFSVTVFCALNDPLFAKSSSLTVHVDGRNTVVKRLKRDVEDDVLVPMEHLTYRIDEDIIRRLANGGDAYIMLGQYNIRPMSGLPQLLYNILQFTSDGAKTRNDAPTQVSRK